MREVQHAQGRIYANTMLLFVLCVLAASVSAENTRPVEKVLAGSIERVSFAALPDLIVNARLDTGATTSSIHAQNVRAFNKQGQEWVRFDLILVDDQGEVLRKTLESPRKRVVRIKNHDGNHDLRYVVELALCFNGGMQSTSFTLADRSEFNYPVLLGREFLNGRVIIDPEETFITDMPCN